MILDTGFVAEVDDKAQVAFRDFFTSIVFNDASACCRIIKESALSYDDFNHYDFENEISKLLNEVSCMEAQKFQVSKFVLTLFEVQRKYGIYSTPDFTLPIISLLVYEGTTKKYCPTLDFQRIAVPFITSSLIKKLAV